jgi:cell division protein FtsB
LQSNQKESCDALLREISVYENKLEKANQKLNEIVAHNNEMREKINVLRKEKNVVEEIYK